jgi:KamA family protein
MVNILHWKTTTKTDKIRYFTLKNIDNMPQLSKFSAQQRLEMKAVANILPFRVNQHVLDLIDWMQIPDDPIFRLTFPQPEMVSRESLEQIIALLKQSASKEKIAEVANKIRHSLNPHPAGQMQANVPYHQGHKVLGMQHKYDQTCLVFPSQGQSCHAYCSYCFRWAQFVGIDELKFATRESGEFQQYLKKQTEVTDVLFTGGDPLTIRSNILALYIEPLLNAEFDHIQTIRIGTKSVAYWPQRFCTDDDADTLLELFERVTAAGKHLAVMAHYTHPREILHPMAQRAIQRIRATGVEIRCQTPIVRYVNDSAETLTQLWQTQINSGCIPYYLFVERNTGAKAYFEIPLVKTWKLYQNAMKKLSGLGRTVRGPVMSCQPGKILVEGTANIRGEDIFVLKFLQARNANWCYHPFFAKFDPQATWFTDLVPAFGDNQFFFEQEIGHGANS